MKTRPDFLNRLSSKARRRSYLARFANYLERASFIRIWVRVNQSLTVPAILIAIAALYLALAKYDVDQRRGDEERSTSARREREDRIAGAWNVVNRMAGKQSNGGQVSALERLVELGVSLEKIDLHNTFLTDAHLPKAGLANADLSGANLTNVVLTSASLKHANLRGATLIGANLIGASLIGADLAGAKLMFAQLDESVVHTKSLKGADVTGAIVVARPARPPRRLQRAIVPLSEADKKVNERFAEACGDPAFSRIVNAEQQILVSTKPCATASQNYERLAVAYTGGGDGGGGDGGGDGAMRETMTHLPSYDGFSG